MRRSLVGVACLLSLVLSGCGDDTATEDPDAAPPSASQSSTDSAEETQTPDGPACEEVWSDGQDLAQGYKGCVEGSTWVAADTRRCESGQVIVIYADRYYAAKGAVVNDMGESLEDSAQYQKALRSCG